MKVDENVSKLEPTKENLHQKYIVENVPLREMSEIFDVPYSTIRKRLKTYGIAKDYKASSENTYKAMVAKHGENAFAKHFAQTKTKESSQKAQRAGIDARRRNAIARDIKDGITYDSLYELYIVKNMTIKELSAHFGRPFNNIRKSLVRYKVPAKSREAIEKRRLEAMKELYSDPERVKEIVMATQKTIRETYGANWCYNNASKLELEVLTFVKSLLPEECDVVSGNYSVISKPGSGGAMQLDIHIPSMKIAIEVNGRYWHSRENYEQDLTNGTECTREALKDRLCKEKGIRLFHVWEDDWKRSQQNAMNQIESFLSQGIQFF